MNREQMIQRQQELLNTARAAQRELTAEEQAEFDSLQRSIDALDAPADPTPAAPQGESPEDVRAAEQERCMEITNLCRDFNVSAEDTNNYLRNGTSVDAVRAAILNNMRATGAPIASRGRAELTTDEQDKFRAAAGDALVMRSGISVEKPAEGARQLMGMSLRDLAIECLEKEGHTGLNRKSSDELFVMLMSERQFFSPTAAFPAILDNAINKAYVEGHKTVAVTFDQWTKRGQLSDFKISDNNYLAGPAGEFLEVPEGGELKHDDYRDEKMPTRKLRTYGRQFTLTRQAFINDDIGLITKRPAAYAASARKTINKQCYQILVYNPAVYDGAKLFGSTHKNLLAKGTGITREAVQGMILALQNQKDQFGEAIIVRPATIIVPSGYKFDMYTLFFSPTINTSDNTQAANPLYAYKDSITVVEDPTINALCGGFGNKMPWWLLGDKNDTDFVEVDYLNGKDIPSIRRMEAPGVLGFIWDIYLDWGISVMDYRGAIKNPGIEIKNPIELA